MWCWWSSCFVFFLLIFLFIVIKLFLVMSLVMGCLVLDVNCMFLFVNILIKYLGWVFELFLIIGMLEILYWFMMFRVFWSVWLGCIVIGLIIILDLNFLIWWIFLVCLSGVMFLCKMLMFLVWVSVIVSLVLVIVFIVVDMSGILRRIFLVSWVWVFMLEGNILEGLGCNNILLNVRVLCSFILFFYIFVICEKVVEFWVMVLLFIMICMFV